MIDTLSKLFGSRTILILTALFTVLNVPEFQALVPEAWLPWFNNVLILGAMWFRAHPQAKL